MNDNPGKVRTDGDAMNDEHFSAVGAGNVLTVDSRVLDRIFPSAVAGDTMAFTYEDLVRDGSATLAWNRVPESMPAVRALVGSSQFGVLVWRSNGGAAPTELHLPGSFTSATTVVVSGVDAVSTISGDRLLLSTKDSGRVHFALVTNSGSTPQRDAARAELANWAARTFS